MSSQVLTHAMRFYIEASMMLSHLCAVCVHALAFAFLLDAFVSFATVPPLEVNSPASSFAPLCADSGECYSGSS